MQHLLDFFSGLSENNNKPWFDAHKIEYLKIKAYFESLTARLIEGIGEFDPSVRNLTVKECTYRIYRDLRFSRDKTPYKNHIGAFICPFGKCSGYSGYYFHIQPVPDDTMFETDSHMLATGIYFAPREVLKSVREDIDCNGDNFDSSVKEAAGFEMDIHGMMKRVPVPYPQDHPYARYLKCRAWCLDKKVDSGYVLSENLVGNLVEDYRKTFKFCQTLNKAIAYAYDRDWPY
ncbi:MAG: DUF2461 domain-containing protein [Bacteroidales bacterium]|nr:DUF2461 domain-containing protein [Bacteroidales bacterium]